MLLLLLSITISVSAANISDHPVNPSQKEVWEFERQLNLESKSVLDDYQIYLTLTQITAPALNAAAKWKLTPDSGHGSITYLYVELLMKDYSTSYTTVWMREYSSNNIPSNIETCVIVTSGEYMLFVTADYSDGTVGRASIEFSISGTSALTAKVAQIVSSCTKSSEWETALCLHDWLTHNMYYDDTFEYYGADGALLRGYGVCDSYSKAYFMLCQKAGIPVGRVLSDNHAWNIIKLNGKWYYVDVTWDDPWSDWVPVSGYEHHDYFCLDEETLTIDHTILGYEGEYGLCTSLEMNYFVVTGEWKNWAVHSSYTNKFVPVIDDISRAFEYYGETSYTINKDTTIYCEYREGFGRSCFGFNEVSYNILKFALPLAAADFRESDGTPMNVKITQSPFTVTLLTPIDILRLPDHLYIIESKSFYGIGAEKVILPGCCLKIESQAFADSKVKKVIIPDDSALYDSANIADDAFANCSGLIFVTKNEAAIEYAQSHGITVRNK